MKFLGVVILGNIAALLMLLIPGVNIIAFFVVNGYLLGREFFEFAAMRFRPEMEAKALRSKHATTVFLGGLVIAAFMAIPILNLLTPLFAAAMMVHLHKAVAQSEPPADCDQIICGGSGTSGAGISEVFSAALQISAITQEGHSGLRALQI